MSKPLDKAVFSLLQELCNSDNEKAIQARALQVELAYEQAIHQIFFKEASLILQHTNAVYCFVEKEKETFVVYCDDSTVRSFLDTKQGILKIALQQQGFNYRIFKALPSKKSIKDRHPFCHTASLYNHTQTKTSQNQVVQLTSKLSQEEKEEVDMFVSEIEDNGIKQALKQAVISYLSGK